MVFEKTKKKNSRKTGLPVKPEYSENRETSETFFSDSFLRLNSLQAFIKKNDLLHTSCPEAYQKDLIII